MDRTLLNTIPFGWLLVIVVAIAVTIGIGGFLLMRRFVPSLGENSEKRTLSSAFAISSSMFAFLLAFTIGQLYTNYTRAKQDAKNEANTIAQLVRVSDGLASQLGLTVRSEALAYTAEVHNREFKLMQDGNTDPVAWEDIDALYGTLERARTTSNGDPFYSQTVAQVNTLAAARQTRLDDINLSIPTLFKVLLLGLALLAIYGTFYFKPFGEPLQVIMIGAASALIGLGLLVAMELDYPYSGTVSISSAPFTVQSVTGLSQGA